MDALLRALCSVRFWRRQVAVRFNLGSAFSEEAVVIQYDHRSVSLGMPHPPDLLLVSWAAEGGLLDERFSGEMMGALDLGLLEDTRERWGHETAVFRFARCRVPGHRVAAGGYRVLCEDCLAPIREAYAEGEERARAREAVLMLEQMARETRADGSRRRW